MSGPINAVIDLSHHNGDVDLVQAKADGVLGVIQKATQGQRNVDPTYEANRQKAADAGLLWGAYHFGTGSDGVGQAEHFLSIAGRDQGVLRVLDLEPNPTGPSMSLEEARAFIVHVEAETGVCPGLYSGHYVKQLLGGGSDPVLAKCWLWLAQYGPRPVVPPNWPTWTMWQYTDGAVGPEPHTVAGVGRCDRDMFNGSAAQLRKLWRAA